jgi:HK97 family phage major capsid protein
MGFSASGGHTESVNELGGALVPAEFESDLIDLRERFGLFRTWARYTPMTSDTKSRPRRRGGLTAYFVGGGQDGTRSKGAWDRVKLVAKKAMVLALYESELNEDSIIDIGDTFAGEIAYAFAKLEDQCGFIGDGTSTYGDIVGVTEKLKGLDITIANIAGLQVASGNAWSEIALTDFNFLVGRLPEYADTPNTAWFCHKAFYHGVMEKLMLAAGGVTAQEVAAGRRNPVFMGYPVRITQAMPKTEANSQVACLFGDLALSAMFGDRRGTTIALSEHAEFESDELLIRGTERFDINVHDVGNASATAALREAGPMVGLITAAS